MSFLDTDQSRTLGSPYLLLLFRYGPESDQVYAYTNNESTILFGGNAYEPVPLDTDAIKSRGVNGKSEFSVRLPNDSEISRMFRFFPPPYPVSLTIYQGHRTDLAKEHPVVWTGKVLSAKPGANLETSFSCEWIAVSLRRIGAARKWQYSCGHPLYGPKCRADKAAATTEATVSSVNGLRVTLIGDWSGANEYANYPNGSVSWETPNGREHRSIVDVLTDGTLSLSNRPSGLLAGATVQVSLGCNRLTSDCRALHNNIHNFGGQPWIPEVNPVNRNNY
jgi:hypothetical protein